MSEVPKSPIISAKKVAERGIGQEKDLTWATDYLKFLKRKKRLCAVTFQIRGGKIVGHTTK